MIQPTLKRTSKVLTGKFRYRVKKGWFKNTLVLQAEWKCYAFHYPSDISNPDSLELSWKDSSLLELASFSDPIIQPLTIEELRNGLFD